ncbi:MAG: hypothetical protein ABIJ56_03700 [Pseudomonadota bacterium]
MTLRNIFTSCLVLAFAPGCSPIVDSMLKNLIEDATQDAATDAADDGSDGDADAAGDAPVDVPVDVPADFSGFECFEDDTVESPPCEPPVQCRDGTVECQEKCDSDEDPCDAFCLFFTNTCTVTRDFRKPVDLVVDGIHIYVVDEEDCTVKHVRKSDGAADLFAGASGDCGDTIDPLRLDHPVGIAKLKNYLFVVDASNSRIVRIDIDTHSARVAVGTGGYCAVPFEGAFKPRGIVGDGDNTLYVSDHAADLIYRIERAGDEDNCGVFNYSGSGGDLNDPTGLAYHDKLLYIADTENHKIKMIDTSITMPPYVVHTIAGTGAGGFQDGRGAQARFKSPVGVAVDPQGLVLIVSDQANDLIREIELTSGEYSVSTFAGALNTPASGDYCKIPIANGGAARVNSPSGAAFDTDAPPFNRRFYFCDTGCEAVKLGK